MLLPLRDLNAMFSRTAPAASWAGASLAVSARKNGSRPMCAALLRPSAGPTTPVGRVDRADGFTLLEVLTAMALFFMVAGILVSGVSQAIRVAEVGAVESTNSRDQSMRLVWFRETVGLTVLPALSSEKLDPPPPLIGSARTVSGLSIAVPNAPTRGPTPYRFDIVFNPATGDTELQLANETTVGSPVGVTLATWRGGEGRFFYLDEDGSWHGQWPRLNTTSGGVGGISKATPRSALPTAVELRYGDAEAAAGGESPRGAGAHSVVVAIQDRTIPPPSLRELLK